MFEGITLCATTKKKFCLFVIKKFILDNAMIIVKTLTLWYNCF